MESTKSKSNFIQLAQPVSRNDSNINNDVGLKHWGMAQDKQITYLNSNSHTLSFYLKGGSKNYRKGYRHQTGAPGLFCFMKQEQESTWYINQQVEFVHLYFSDRILKHYASTSFDMDVRGLELEELIFQQDPQLTCLFGNNIQLMKNWESSSPLYIEQAINDVMHHLLSHYNKTLLKEQVIKGGLSPTHRKLVRCLIQENLSQKLTIEYLAEQLDLSPFHFARMFKLSFGESPANFITRTRIENIKHLLNSDIPLSHLSIETGFSQQSHMSNAFKKLTGFSPAQYRTLLTN